MELGKTAAGQGTKVKRATLDHRGATEPREGYASPRVITPEGAVTARRFERDVLCVADGLKDVGVDAGDRVMVKGENSYAYCVALFALMHLNTSVVLVDNQQTPEETENLAARSAVRWRLLGEPQHRKISDGHTIAYEGFIRTCGSRSVPGSFSLARWREREDAAILWTSGSTGQPKGVVKSGRAIVDNAVCTGDATGYKPDDVLMPLLPFSHQYGFSVLLTWWVARCSLVIAPYKLIGRVVRHIATDGVTVVDATPATYHSLVGYLRKKPETVARLSGVRMWCVGGAPLSSRIEHDFYRVLHRQLLDGYGLTELGNVAVSSPQNPVSCGPPLKGVEVCVVDEDGHRLPADRVGEIWVSSPGLMEGYLVEDGAILPQEQGWYPTEDLGYLDSAGNLHVIGRKQAVHRMGYTLYPASLERQVELCGCTAKVVGIDDDRRGALLFFFVEDPEERGVRYWKDKIHRRLAPYERPNVILTMDKLPLNRNGKVDSIRLKEMAVDHAKVSTGEEGA
ncbi:class I adenylate-forming enzyme family protein [Rubrobacter radiotolerans]|uniref:Class I adenylate-forming enzyme family protein n=1 Tax=Rubrobacter radiotolerans TaxID=42256 RepID=A0AB35T6Y3_RUBRA|nr:class I adenylate-forming enzyme family protein [Rubrobacter radiotolerans]MDX5895312.1 class I adenylate-forming enzyme family protein [Rubrobacter radiotolerans]SMC01622.1 Acyl-CoA synthetase (AMP-forming)/AMP-acid ligase II [Rubrobacter radiotolerans DSM 5868]